MPRALLVCGRVVALSLAALSCAGRGALPQSQTLTPAPKASAAPVLNAREHLAQSLRTLARRGPVLDALPGDVQKRLEQRVASLDAERKISVHNDESPLVESLPLLHLASGGTSPRALFALATTPAGSDELAGLMGVEHGAAASNPDHTLIALVRELAERAALNFLRDRAADLAGAGKATPLVCHLVARAALAVARRDLVLQAQELLAEVEPNPENHLDLAYELARAGQPERAARELASALSDKTHSPLDATVLAIQHAIAAAGFVAAHATPSSDLPTRLALARAWLHLGHASDARSVLAADGTAAETDLALATALAETLIDAPACPELPPGVGSAALCAESFRSSGRVKSALSLLDRAWHSGSGRDDEVLEAYVSLAHIIPWMHETAFAMSGGVLSAAEASERILGLRAKIQEVVAVAPRLAGLSLFVETLHTGVTQGTTGLRSAADAAALAARALTLAVSDSSHFAQAGVLAVAATLSRQQDIAALVDAVPIESTAPGLRVPRAALSVWAAASTGSHARMDSARAELAQIMAEGRGSSLERARLVLSTSEADALLDGSERAYQLLSRVSGQLLSDSIPPDLAFRAVLDASGALAHGKKLERAQEILTGAASAELPSDLDRARDLLQLVRGYRVVLAAGGGDAGALSKARAGLAMLAQASGGESAAVWFELWRRELEAREQDLTCQKQKRPACREAEQLRSRARQTLDTRLGAASTDVLLRGALPGGTFDAGFRFSAETGLEPFIVFDPSLLAIGLPKIAVQR